LNDRLDEREWNIENPWTQASSLPRPKEGSTALAVVLFGVACAAIPLSLYHSVVALLLGVALVLGSAFLLKNKRMTLLLAASALLAALAPGMILPVSGSFYPVFGAVAAALCVSVAAGAYYQTVTRLAVVPILLSVIIAGAVYALKGDLLWATLAIVPLPSMLLVSISTRKGMGATTVICFGVGGLLLTGAILAAVWLKRTLGAISTEAINGLLDQWKEGFALSQIQARDQLMAEIDEMKGMASMTAETLKRLDEMKEMLWERMSDSVIRASLNQTFLLIPAAAVVIAVVASFLSQRLLNGYYAANGLSEVVTPEAEFVTVSVPAAALYVLCVVVVAAAPSFSVVGVAASNLCLILVPAMLYLALGALRPLLRRLMRIRRVFPIILLALICYSTSGILLVAATVGACDRLFRALRRAVDRKFSNGDGNPPD